MQRQQAVDRLVGFADQLRSTIPTEVNNVEEQWDNDGNLYFSFTAMGMKIDGSMVTCESQVTVSGKIPFAALPFRGAIESAIRERLQSAFR